MRIVAAALMLLSTLPAVPAVELDYLLEMTPSRTGQIHHVLPDEAREFLANRTFRADLSALPAETVAALPFASDAILYFAANGDLLAWSAKSGIVEGGYWEILVPGSFNELCVRFGKFGLNSVCSSPQIANSDWLRERATGNSFALEAGKPVPATLEAGPFILTDIAALVP